jgi:hypothetical protein
MPTPGANRCNVREPLAHAALSVGAESIPSTSQALASTVHLGHRCGVSPLRQARSVRLLFAELGKRGLNSLAQLIRHVVAASVGDHSAQLELE